MFRALHVNVSLSVFKYHSCALNVRQMLDTGQQDREAEAEAEAEAEVEAESM